ncbi:MAG: type II toxin-antitoxin system RelE/ParE family toxin [Pseudomonadota bacterium]
MRVFKNKWFQKWAAKEGLSDEALQTAVEEMEDGLTKGVQTKGVGDK